MPRTTPEEQQDRLAPDVSYEVWRRDHWPARIRHTKPIARWTEVPDDKQLLRAETFYALEHRLEMKAVLAIIKAMGIAFVAAEDGRLFKPYVEVRLAEIFPPEFAEKEGLTVREVFSKAKTAEELLASAKKSPDRA